MAALYAGLTAWSGLFLSGQLGGLTGAASSLGGGRGRRVCILGASGGVGHLAAQMCRAEGADVVATCAADAHELVSAAGVEHVIDYRAADAEQRLAESGPYDIVLDCAGYGGDYARKVRWSYGHYVTFTSPLLANNDAYGLLGGSVRNVLQLVADNWNTKMAAATGGGGIGGGIANGLVKWAYVVTLPQAVEYLKRLLEEGKVCACACVMWQQVGKRSCVRSHILFYSHSSSRPSNRCTISGRPIAPTLAWRMDICAARSCCKCEDWDRLNGV